MHRILASVFAFVLIGIGTLHAQVPGRQAAAPAIPQGSGEVSGSVVDAEGDEPIYGASVAVWSKADSSLVAGDIARRDGAFQVQGLPPGTYHLQITSIGYGPHRSDVLGRLQVRS